MVKPPIRKLDVAWSVMEPSAVEIRTPSPFTETANQPCEGWLLLGRGIKHILSVELHKHSSCSHPSLEAWVAVFSQTEPSLSLGESGWPCTSSVSHGAALILIPLWARHTVQSVRHLVFGSRVQVRCSWAWYFCALDSQDVSCSPRLKFILRPSQGWGHFAVLSQRPPSKSVWCFFGCSIKFPEQDVLD